MIISRNIDARDTERRHYIDRVFRGLIDPDHYLDLIRIQKQTIFEKKFRLSDKRDRF